ncbi:MAG TPA: hypothetical protein VFF04_06960 [Candidatus Babeliales bacterium]|nr:hypothetical protein [Candidatus Babeliales bacterium]
MAIDILIVKEDLNTVITYFHSIEPDQNYYQLKRIARQLNLFFLSTIDEGGDMLINRLQAPLMIEEIKQLRGRTDIKQEILDEIDKALDYMLIKGPHLYLKFFGD